MISRMFVSLTRDDGQPDNTLIRVLGVVHGRGFQIRGAKLHEHQGEATAHLEVAYKGRSENEQAARGEIMRLLSIHTLTEMRAAAMA